MNLTLSALRIERLKEKSYHPFLLGSLILGLLYFLESTLAEIKITPGIFLCPIEALFSALAAIKISRRIKSLEVPLKTRKSLQFLFFFFVLLSATDATYLFLFYILKTPRTTYLSIALCTVPYTIAFLSCTFAMISLTRIKKDFYSNWEELVLPLAISTPVLFKLLNFLNPLILNSYANNQINLYLITKIINILASFALLNCSLAVLINTRDRHWSLFSVGIIFLVLVNCALETQNLSGTPFQFGFFEFFWATGILLCTLTVLMSSETSFEVPAHQDFSLTSHYRQLILLIISASLGIIHFVYPINLTAIRTVTALTALGCLSSVLLSQFLAEKILELLSDYGKSVHENPQQNAKPTKNNIPSLIHLPIELRDNLKSILETQLTQELALTKTAEIERQKIRQEAQEKLNTLATQFAHDIRSPIAALDIALNNLKAEPEDTGQLIQAVAQRIKDIANKLLEENSNISEQQSPLWESLEKIVEEKRWAFRQNKFGPESTKERALGGSFPPFEKQVAIELSVTPEAKQAKTKIPTSEIKTILSNLINNSFEALPQTGGALKVNLSQADSQNLILTISDNGIGISNHIIPQLFKKGATFGKPGGMGLGLYHAKTTLESAGGKIKICSIENQGTTIELTLPPMAETQNHSIVIEPI